MKINKNMFTVLIVDDDKELAKVYGQLISKMYAANVFIVNNAYHAISILNSKFPIHLAILDIRLPGMDGFKLMEKIHEVSLSTSIIMNSGYPIQEERKLYHLENGVEEFFMKPVRLDDLNNKVKTCYERHVKRFQPIYSLSKI